MKTFKEFQEDYTNALNLNPAKPLTDLIGVGMGAYKLGKNVINNVFQARKAKKARKPYEKKGTSNTGKPSEEEMLKRVREAQKRINNEINPDLNRPTDLDIFTGKKVSPEIKRKINKPENQFNSYNPIEEEAPTNNVGGGQIAGTVEAGDDPPVKKKKKKGKKKTYAYGGRGSRKMWMT